MATEGTTDEALNITEDSSQDMLKQLKVDIFNETEQLQQAQSR